MPNVTEFPMTIEIVKLFISGGMDGVLLLLGFLFMRQVESILKRYSDDMKEQRQMYENNVELVRDYHTLAKDLKEIIILNTQTNTRLIDRLDDEINRRKKYERTP